jgi:light-regulated signal transduction histidine kinase (bacteriophytochrome)
MGDLGVNLAGIEVILRMLERMAELQNRLEETEAELRSLREVDDV